MLKCVNTAFRASTIEDADGGGIKAAVLVAVRDGGGRCGTVAYYATDMQTVGMHRCSHPAVVDAVRATQGRAHETGTIITALHAACDFHAANSGTFDITERRSVVNICLINAYVERMASAVKGAAERIVCRTHHRRDIDVGSEQHVLPGKGLSGCHSLGKGCPIGI